MTPNKSLRLTLDPSSAAAGVFLGVFAYEKFTEYRVKLAMQEMMENLQQTQAKHKHELERKQATQAEQKRKAEFERSTACGINEDKGLCMCMNRETGARVNVAHEECEKRARELTW